jgi:hypothetical protein
MLVAPHLVLAPVSKDFHLARGRDSGWVPVAVFPQDSQAPLAGYR